MNLSTPMIVLLRELRENRSLGGSDRTRNALRRRGLIEGSGASIRLTTLGRDVIDEYLNRTGDGPEHLKAMLRF